MFTKTRRESSALTRNSQPGDLRFSAKTISSTVGIEAVPGYLYCNGAAISRATYKRLFDLVGSTFGAGDGSTTFNLPDFRGRFLSGYTDGSAASVKISSLVLGGVLGAESVALAKAHLPTHTHGVGTLAVGASGSHAHGWSGFYRYRSNSAANDYAIRGQVINGGVVRAIDGGAITAASHAHPSGEWGGSVGDGSADSLAGTAHQNVHPHQAFGGVLVAY